MAYALAGFADAAAHLSALGDELNLIVRMHLSSGPFLAISDEIAADLYHCAYKRAVLGDAPHFFEELFTQYQSGLWPCGWKGNYPAGSLICFAIVDGEVCRDQADFLRDRRFRTRRKMSEPNLLPSDPGTDM